MKASLFLAALAVSFAAAVSAQAQTTAPAPTPDAPPMRADFATHRTKILAHIDQRMAAMTAMRVCVTAAGTRADLKSCHKQERRAMHSHHAPA
jgi:Spy/CpxP family protein refolding chaperone